MTRPPPNTTIVLMHAACVTATKQARLSTHNSDIATEKRKIETRSTIKKEHYRPSAMMKESSVTFADS